MDSSKTEKCMDSEGFIKKMDQFMKAISIITVFKFTEDKFSLLK